MKPNDAPVLVSEDMLRPLSQNEKDLIVRMARMLNDAERLPLLDDLSRATAAPANPDGSRLLFQLFGYERPPYCRQRAYGVDGSMLDQDGVRLSVALYADENGRLLELEFIRWGDGEFLGPQWETLELF